MCTNNANKPSNIPNSEWLIKDKIYTVVEVKTLALQNNTIGYVLKEIQLSEESFPYEFYSASRFNIITTNVLQEELVEELTY